MNREPLGGQVGPEEDDVARCELPGPMMRCILVVFVLILFLVCFSVYFVSRRKEL